MATSTRMQAERVDGESASRPRRFEPRRLDDEFIDLAEERIDAIEQAGLAARDELLDDLADREDHASDREARRLRGMAAELDDQIDRLLAITGRMRHALEAPREDDAPGAPSAGVKLLINRLRVAGRSEAEIASVLAELGVKDTRAVVHGVLEGRPHI